MLVLAFDSVKRVGMRGRDSFREALHVSDEPRNEADPDFWIFTAYAPACRELGRYVFRGGRMHPDRGG